MSATQPETLAPGLTPIRCDGVLAAIAWPHGLPEGEARAYVEAARPGYTTGPAYVGTARCSALVVPIVQGGRPS